MKIVYSKNLKSFDQILHAWIGVVEKYIKFSEFEDNPWWYNERATLSTLAAAIWECNGVALEEFSTEKGKIESPWKGRCDLYIGLKSEHFACEAKQAWCPIGRKARNGLKVVNNSLGAACDDARKLDKQEGNRLGLCFATPYLPPIDEDHVSTQINNWINVIREKIICDSYALIFPNSAKKFQSHDGYFFPGVALFIKKVYRQT